MIWNRYSTANRFLRDHIDGTVMKYTTIGNTTIAMVVNARLVVNLQSPSIALQAVSLSVSSGL